MNSSDYLKEKAGEWFKKGDSDIKTAEILVKDADDEFERYRNSILALNKYSIEPRYPSDIPIYYSIDETKKAIELAVEVIKFVKRKGAEQKWK